MRKFHVTTVTKLYNRLRSFLSKNGRKHQVALKKEGIIDSMSKMFFGFGVKAKYYKEFENYLKSLGITFLHSKKDIQILNKNRKVIINYFENEKNWNSANSNVGFNDSSNDLNMLDNSLNPVAKEAIKKIVALTNAGEHDRVQNINNLLENECSIARADLENRAILLK